jgi:hypothetical protein
LSTVAEPEPVGVAEALPKSLPDGSAAAPAAPLSAPDAAFAGSASLPGSDAIADDPERPPVPA